MDDFLPWSTLAFRTVQGLPLSGGQSPKVLPPDGLAAWARQHRLSGLLAAGIPETGSEFQTAALGRAWNSSRWTAEAERLFGLLSASIPSLALLKGPALAVQAWPEPALRSFDDLDFLCTRRAFRALVSGMRAAGYAPVASMPRLAHLWHYGWGITFHHPDGYRADVHHGFFPLHYPWPRGLDAERLDVFADVRLDAAAVRAPAPALHLLVCCLHAVWHGWARLAWIVDIAGLLARHPDGFDRAMELAASCPFARRALAAGGAVAEALFGPGLCPAAAPESVVKEAVALLGGTARGLQGRELRTFHEQFMTRTERTTCRLRRIFTPGDGDFRWLVLPPALRGLYWLMRPVRGALYGLR
jgi:hypothetical protein